MTLRRIESPLHREGPSAHLYVTPGLSVFESDTPTALGTAEPATPTYSITITTGYMWSMTKNKWGALMTRAASHISIDSGGVGDVYHYSIGINDSNYQTSSGSIIAGGSSATGLVSVPPGIDVQVGDTVDYKFWGNASDVTLSYFSFFTFPHLEPFSTVRKNTRSLMYKASSQRHPIMTMGNSDENNRYVTDFYSFSPTASFSYSGGSALNTNLTTDGAWHDLGAFSTTRLPFRTNDAQSMSTGQYGSSSGLSYPSFVKRVAIPEEFIIKGMEL